MPPGRNDPCPCGSGRKYKRCCEPRDRAESRGRGPDDRFGSASLYDHPGRAADLRRAARRDATWEAAVVPLPGGIESDPEEHMVVILVATRDLVLGMETVSNLPGEPEAVAEALGAVLEKVFELTEVRPRWVEVYHEEVAAALAPALGAQGVTVEATGTFDRALDPARSLLGEVAGVDFWPPVGHRQVWAGWQLPEEEVAGFFRVAAAFHRAAPWSVLSDADPLEIEGLGGDPVVACVLGQGAQMYGLALYERAEDLLRLYGEEFWDEEDHLAYLETVRGAVVTLLFEPVGDLPRPMRKEVARAGWEVAAPHAYPVLSAMNTPGGGVSRAAIKRFTRILELIPRYLDESEASGPLGSVPGEWTDPDTGAVVRPLEEGPRFSPSPARPLEEFGYPLSKACAQGPGARPGAVFPFPEGWADDEDPDEEARARLLEEFHVVHRFGETLEAEGLGEATIRDHVRNVHAFVFFLVAWQGTPVAGVSDLDLRLFLFDWHPREHQGGMTRARKTPVSLDRFFQFLADEEGIECPWAWEVLDDRDYIAERLEWAPVGAIEDPEVEDWRSEVVDEVRMELLRPEMHLLEGLDEMEPGPEAIGRIRELHRSWLRWRDEIIDLGVDDPREVRPLLLERMQEWGRERLRA